MTDREKLLQGLARTCEAMAIQKMGGFEAWVGSAIDEIVMLDRQVKELVALLERRHQLDPVEVSDRLAEILRKDWSRKSGN